MTGFEALLTGHVLAKRYRIEEVIGRGGMGAVYRSTDERLGREVAVKVITVAGTGEPGSRERLRARFHREARAAAGLPHHPNVVPVYDYGTDSELGLDFLVMELLRGEDLTTLFARSGPPPLSSAIWILYEAARGVAVGHRAGLIHRDVKPGNIFLARRNGSDEVEVRILDFGIAKLTTEEESDLTRDGRVPLSPAYASPEQLRGLSQLTPASDVFSLGAVGFQLLTGDRPFTEMDRNRMSLGMAVPAPSTREQNPAIPPGIDEIVQRSLAYDPGDRWQDAAALAAVLEQARREMSDAPLPPYIRVPAPEATAMATAVRTDEATELLDDETWVDPRVHGNEPPVAPPPPTAAVGSTSRRRTRKREGRRGGWVVTSLVVLLLLVAGGIFGLSVMDDSEPPATEPESESEALPEVPPILPDPTVESADVEPADMLDGAMNNFEGLRYYEQGDYTLALEQFRRAVAISPDVPEYRYNYGLTLLQLGLAAEAADELTRVIEQDPGRTAAHYNLGEARLALGDTAAAIESFSRVLALSTDPREQGITERRIRFLRTIQDSRDLPPVDSLLEEDSIAEPTGEFLPLGPSDADAAEPEAADTFGTPPG